MTEPSHEQDVKKARARLVENAEKQKKRFDTKRADSQKYLPGEYVLASTAARRLDRLEQQYIGPFRVTSMLEGDRYSVVPLEGRNKRIFAAEQPRLWPKEWDV